MHTHIRWVCYRCRCLDVGQIAGGALLLLTILPTVFLFVRLDVLHRDAHMYRFDYGFRMQMGVMLNRHVDANPVDNTYGNTKSSID